MAERTPGKPDFEETGHDPVDEPVFEPAPEQTPPDEPVFAPVDAGPGPGSAPPTDRAGGADEYGWFDAEGNLAAPQTDSNRRLGRTGPFWAIGAAIAIVVILVFWLSLGRSGPEEPRAGAVTPSAGEAGSAALTEADPPTPTSAPPTPTPIPLLGVGQEVVVGNTNGAGIRLRGEPGLAGLTLEIYGEGAPFVVLDPGSEYATYPVEIDGYVWYRIRAQDETEVVGWAVGDYLTDAGE